MGPKTMLVSDHPDIGVVVDMDGRIIAFGKKNGCVDLNTAHDIPQLPDDALFRNVNNITIQEAAGAYVEQRKPRWWEKIC